MLDKKLLNKADRKKYKFNFLNNIFQKSVDTLSAEYIILHKAETSDIDTFMADLRRKPRIKAIPFTKDCVNGKFVKCGRFICFDTERASKYLFDSMLDFWLAPQKDYVGENEIVDFRHFFYEKYFSKIESVEVCETAKNFVFPITSSFFGIINQNEVLKGIIAGYIKANENILYYICPLYPHMEYEISLKDYTPHFLRMVEQQGSNIFLRNADTSSADFIMALAEGLRFFTDEHKTEFFARLSTLKICEGKTV